MKKFDWNHPVTRKDYAVLCGWSFGIVMVIYGIAIAVTYLDDIKDWAGIKVEKIKTTLVRLKPSGHVNVAFWFFGGEF